MMYDHQMISDDDDAMPGTEWVYVKVRHLPVPSRPAPCLGSLSPSYRNTCAVFRMGQFSELRTAAHTELIEHDGKNYYHIISTCNYYCLKVYP